MKYVLYDMCQNVKSRTMYIDVRALVREYREQV